MQGKELKKFFVEALQNQYDEREAENMFYLAMDHFSDQTRLEWDMNYAKGNAEPFFDKIKPLIQPLKKGKPIQQLLGVVWFYDMQLMVDENVLIPRPETEELVDWIVDKNMPRNPKSILDIGTGSGCIALALAQNFPLSATEAWDVSELALNLAKKNAVKLELDNIQFFCKNILDNHDTANQNWDIIVSNPPYILPEEANKLSVNVRAYEPDLALFVTNQDPLQFYRAIGEYAMATLNPSGHLFFECHESHAVEVKEWLCGLGFEDVILKEDMQGKPRMVMAVRP